MFGVEEFGDAGNNGPCEYAPSRSRDGEPRRRCIPRKDDLHPPVAALQLVEVPIEHEMTAFDHAHSFSHSLEIADDMGGKENGGTGLPAQDGNHFAYEFASRHRVEPG